MSSMAEMSSAPAKVVGTSARVRGTDVAGGDSVSGCSLPGLGSKPVKEQPKKVTKRPTVRVQAADSGAQHSFSPQSDTEPSRADGDVKFNTRDDNKNLFSIKKELQ